MANTSELGLSPALERLDLDYKALPQVLSDDLARSDGIAAIIVHPFYKNYSQGGWFKDDFEREKYENYKRRLKISVEKYQNRQIPIILFEDMMDLDKVNETLSKVGMNNGKAYVVKTGISDSRPPDGNGIGLAFSLKEAGLRRAVVLGSQLWLMEASLERIANVDYQQIPRIAKHNK